MTIAPQPVIRFLSALPTFGNRRRGYAFYPGVGERQGSAFVIGLRAGRRGRQGVGICGRSTNGKVNAGSSQELGVFTNRLTDQGRQNYFLPRYGLMSMCRIGHLPEVLRR